MLYSSSSRVRERASKEFLKTVGVAGDEVHPMRAAFAELKKGTDSAASSRVLLLVTCVVQQVLHLAQKTGRVVEALACGGAFQKANFLSWAGILTTHKETSNSRSWVLVFHLVVVEESVCVTIKCSRPPGQCALGAPMKGTFIDKLGGLCVCQRNIFPTLLVCWLFSSSFLPVSTVLARISTSRTS